MKVFIEGKLALSLGARLARGEGLQVGQELPDDRIEALSQSDNFHRCQDAAVRYLAFRPRSEFEIRDRLRRRGFDDSSIEAVITRLKGQGFIDDTVFTRFWKESRETFSPRSRRLTRLELRRKGVEDSVIDGVVRTVDDSDSAYRAARHKARSLPLIDYKTFYQRLGGYLRRRGFDYETTKSTVRRTWKEIGGRSEDSTLT